MSNFPESKLEQYLEELVDAGVRFSFLSPHSDDSTISVHDISIAATLSVDGTSRQVTLFPLSTGIVRPVGAYSLVVEYSLERTGATIEHTKELDRVELNRPYPIYFSASPANYQILMRGGTNYLIHLTPTRALEHPSDVTEEGVFPLERFFNPHAYKEKRGNEERIPF